MNVIEAMGNLKRKVLGSLAAFGVAGGIAVGVAFPAEAGTSIPTTYNAGTKIYFKYYASTNNFCVMQRVSKYHAARVTFDNPVGQFYFRNKLAPGTWSCITLSEARGLKEAWTTKFALELFYKPTTSTVWKKVLGPSSGRVHI